MQNIPLRTEAVPYLLRNAGNIVWFSTDKLGVGIHEINTPLHFPKTDEEGHRVLFTALIRNQSFATLFPCTGVTGVVLSILFTKEVSVARSCRSKIRKSSNRR